jgi:hypothetical protein
VYEGGVHCRFTVVPSTAANKSLGAGGGKSNCLFKVMGSFQDLV